MVKQALLIILATFLLMQYASAAITFSGPFDVSLGQKSFNKSFCGGCDAKICQGNIEYIALQQAAGYFNISK